MSFGNTSPNVSFGNITANISQGNITSTLGGAPVLADFILIGGGGKGGDTGSLPNYMGYKTVAGGGGTGAIKYSLGNYTPTHTAQTFNKGTVYNIVIGGQEVTSTLIGGSINIRAGGGGRGAAGGNYTTRSQPPALPDATNGGYLGGIGGVRNSNTGYYGNAINASGGNAGGISSSITGTSLIYGASWPAALLVTNNVDNTATQNTVVDSNGYQTLTVQDNYADFSQALHGTYTSTNSTYGTVGYAYYGRGGMSGARYTHYQHGNRRLSPGNGASGVLILRFLTAGNTYVTTGATATTDGDYTVLTWSSGTHTLKFT